MYEYVCYFGVIVVVVAMIPDWNSKVYHRADARMRLFQISMCDLKLHNILCF